ncbi:hypothetical protein [Propionivibrio dicarboxylicus]|uniref:Uncharacterized protein n=1 Tax=Propionivibrio dicarboxylicus TaxID=83767 RepID=A0A1G8NVY3_9RHOO|nr:hypothetical protein [Propionivibrio dicarboxylicus]SDI84377.1 hypothetical protein SAMN05660652_04120 [Propionivibrio dicarboxylicus]
MRTLRFGTLFIPIDATTELALALLLVGLGVLMFGWRKLAFSLFGMAAWSWLPPDYKYLIMDTAFELLELVPWWCLVLLVIWLLYRVAGNFIRDVAVHVASDMMSAAIRWLLTSRLGWSSLISIILGGMLWTRLG